MEVVLSIAGSVGAVGIIGLVGILFQFNGRLAKVETKINAIEEHLKGE